MSRKNSTTSRKSASSKTTRKCYCLQKIKNLILQGNAHLDTWVVCWCCYTSEEEFAFRFQIGPTHLVLLDIKQRFWRNLLDVKNLIKLDVKHSAVLDVMLWWFLTSSKSFVVCLRLWIWLGCQTLVFFCPASGH